MKTAVPPKRPSRLPQSAHGLTNSRKSERAECKLIAPAAAPGRRLGPRAACVAQPGVMRGAPCAASDEGLFLFFFSPPVSLRMYSRENFCRWECGSVVRM